ncbi:MAG: hypothetical protein QM767_23275 [Anaeromyxobacter sp.]
MPPRPAPVLRSATLALAALALACAGVRPAGAPSLERRSFQVEDRGALEVGIPAGWSVREVEGSGQLPGSTLELAPRDRAFVLHLTPLANPAQGATAGADAAQVMAELARRSASESAVEREIALQELRGQAGVHGYWFAVTDRTMEGRTAKPEEFRHLLQGAASVGDLIVVFTLLDNAEGPQREQVLELVRGARQLGGEPARAGGAGADREAGPADGLERDPGAATEPAVLGTGDGKVTALVDLPGFTLYKPRLASDGGSALLVAEQPGEGLVASLLLTRQEGASDARSCRDQALDRIQRAEPGVEALERSERAGAARATYAVHEAGGGTLHHAHAFLQRDGVCVSVHVSAGGQTTRQQQQRLERILASLRLSEVL